MTWMLMADGSHYHLTGHDMAHNDYKVPVLAHHAAQINRFTGAARRPYCVDEHGLLCADIAQDMGLPVVVQLACLVHDLHEAITSDMSSPAKMVLGEYWAAFEGPHARALRRALGLHAAFTAHRAVIKQIDLIALATERRDLVPWTEGISAPWPILDTPGQRVQPHRTSLTTAWREHRHWTEWRDAFVERYDALRGQLRELLARNVQEVMAP